FANLEAPRVEWARLLPQETAQCCEGPTLVEPFIQPRRVRLIEIGDGPMAQEHARHDPPNLAAVQESARVERERVGERAELRGRRGAAGLDGLDRGAGKPCIFRQLSGVASSSLPGGADDVADSAGHALTMPRRGPSPSSGGSRQIGCVGTFPRKTRLP